MTAFPFLILLQIAFSAGMAAMFAVAAMAKLRDRPTWTGMLAAYRLVPDSALGVVTWAIPLAELAVAALLLTGLEAGIFGGVLLLLLFAGAMGINLLRGRRAIDCGCDPRGGAKPIGWGLAARNGTLAALLLLCLVPTGTTEAGVTLLASLAGIGLFFLIQAIATVQSLAPRGAAHGAN